MGDTTMRFFRVSERDLNGENRAVGFATTPFRGRALGAPGPDVEREARGEAGNDVMLGECDDA